jgi:hypothetical protein
MTPTPRFPAVQAGYKAPLAGRTYSDTAKTSMVPLRPKKRASDTKATAIPTPSEHQEQVAVIEWADRMVPRYPELALLYAVPNGARTSIGTAKKLKAEGLRAGVPDLCLPVARGIDHTSAYHGLYVELKRIKGGTVSPEQRGWHEALRAQGYRVVVARGAAEAIAAITQYLEGTT